MKSCKLMLVEDDKELACLIKDYLDKNGFDVAIVNDGLQAATDIPVKQPDMVLLDVMLPGMSGMDVCREVRPRFDGPIIMLTALDEDMDQMLGLELGADDYIIKPVQPRLLLTRIKALLRRIEQAAARQIQTTSNPDMTASDRMKRNTRTEHIVQVDSLIINVSNRSVELAAQAVELTTAEFELLLLLAQNAGHLVDRDFIVQQLRGFDYDGLDRSVDRRISRLRNKLHKLSQGTEIIKTIRGKGYQMCSDFQTPTDSSSL